MVPFITSILHQVEISNGMQHKILSLDPSPLLDTGISESVPQGYFPLTYHTESFL